LDHFCYVDFFTSRSVTFCFEWHGIPCIYIYIPCTNIYRYTIETRCFFGDWTLMVESWGVCLRLKIFNGNIKTKQPTCLFGFHWAVLRWSRLQKQTPIQFWGNC
jgi:hypothetical protein